MTGRPHNYDEVTELISRLLDGRISDDEHARLSAILERDPQARMLYMQYVDMQVELSCQIGENEKFSDDDDAVGVGEVMATPRRKTGLVTEPLAFPDRPLNKPEPRSYRWWAAVAAAAVVSAVVHFWFFQTKPDTPKFDPESSGEIARRTSALGVIGEIIGNVEVTSAEGEARSGDEILPGDIISTAGPDSTVGFTYPDGTKITISGESSLKFLESEAKTIEMPAGNLFATVTKQPPGKPLTILTPQAEIYVLGTKFSLQSNDTQTRLEVTDGRVRLTQTATSKGVEVSKGQFVIADGLNKLEVAPVPSAQVTWSADFKRGLPEGWNGRTVDQKLPLGVNAGARAMPLKRIEEPAYAIETPVRNGGLFPLGNDSHLHFRYRMHRPQPLKLQVHARPQDDAAAPAIPYEILGSDAWKNVRSDVWQSASFPLSSFYEHAGGRSGTKRLAPDQIPVQLSIISLSKQDPALVIDRIWITAQGSGRIDIAPLE